MRVLLPLPDRDFDVTEVAIPWAILRDAGHQVVFATEKAGTVPAADPRLLTGVLFGQLGAAAEARKLYYELIGTPEFGSTVAWADGSGRLRRADPAGRARSGHAAVPRLAGAQRAGRPVLAAEPAGRRDLPRRAGAGAHPRPGHRPQRARRPSHHLPAQVHGAFGLPGHRAGGSAATTAPTPPTSRTRCRPPWTPGQPVPARPRHAVRARHRHRRPLVLRGVRPQLRIGPLARRRVPVRSGLPRPARIRRIFIPNGPVYPPTVRFVPAEVVAVPAVPAPRRIRTWCGVSCPAASSLPAYSGDRLPLYGLPCNTHGKPCKWRRQCPGLPSSAPI